MIGVITEYLGKQASELLMSPPFRHWKFKRTVDRFLPEVRIDYESLKNKFSMTCDSDERINTIFIESDNFDREIFGVPF
jgi:hypothetical protein